MTLLCFMFIFVAGSAQLSNFQLYIVSEINGTEEMVYDNNGVTYYNGSFTIDLEPAKMVMSVVIRRPTADILTLCEVEVFQGSRSC